MVTMTSPPSPDLAISDTASQPDEQLYAIPKTFSASQASNDMKTMDLYVDSDGCQVGTPAHVASNNMGMQGFDARSKMSSLLKDKEQEWTQVLERRDGPLRLLDLPLDILKEIVKEVRDFNNWLDLSPRRLVSTMLAFGRC